MTELRFIERDGKKVLQYRILESGASKVWLDVPLVTEEPKNLAERLRWVREKTMLDPRTIDDKSISEALAAEAKKACVDAILNLYRPGTLHPGDVMANVQEIISLINEL